MAGNNLFMVSHEIADIFVLPLRTYLPRKCLNSLVIFTIGFPIIPNGKLQVA